MTTLQDEFNYRYEGAWAVYRENGRNIPVRIRDAAGNDEAFRAQRASVHVAKGTDDTRVPLAELDLKPQVPSVVPLHLQSEGSRPDQILFASQMPVRTSRKGLRLNHFYLSCPSNLLDNTYGGPDERKFFTNAFNCRYPMLEEAVEQMNLHQPKHGRGYVLSPHFWISAPIYPGQPYFLGYDQMIVGHVDREAVLTLDAHFIDLIESIQDELNVPVHVSEEPLFDHMANEFQRRMFDPIPRERILYLLQVWETLAGFDTEEMARLAEKWRVLNDPILYPLYKYCDAFGTEEARTRFRENSNNNNRAVITGLPRGVQRRIAKELLNPFALLVLAPKFFRSLKRRNNPDDNVDIAVDIRAQMGGHEATEIYTNNPHMHDAFKNWVDEAMLEFPVEFRRWCKECMDALMPTPRTPDMPPEPDFEADLDEIRADDDEEDDDDDF